MERLEKRLEELEARTRKIERRLRWWQLAAVSLLITVLSLWGSLTGQAQVGQGANATAFSAPFEIRGSAGQPLLRVSENRTTTDRNSPREAVLTLFLDGRQSVSLRTTGEMFKDPDDPGLSFLNLFQTWLYQYPNDERGKPVERATLASSLGLTRAGGSFVLWRLPEGDSLQGTQAARLSAKRDGGSSLILFKKDGTVGTTVAP
jgi:hypothetical protein